MLNVSSIKSSWWVIIALKKLLVSNAHGSYSSQSRCQMECVYSPHRKRYEEEWTLHCIAPENTQLPLPASDLIKNGVLLLPYLVWCCQIFTALTKLKSAYVTLWATNHSPPCNAQMKCRQLFTTHIAITIADVQTSYIQLGPSQLGPARPVFMVVKRPSSVRAPVR